MIKIPERYARDQDGVGLRSGGMIGRYEELLSLMDKATHFSLNHIQDVACAT